MQAADTWAIEDALRAEGIEIPFPQMDVGNRSLFDREGDAALDALKLPPKPAARAASARPSPSVNDAAETVVEEAEREARETPPVPA